MLGFSLWFVLAVILSLFAVLVPVVTLRSRAWTYRMLLALGLLCLVWGVLPAFGGGGISPYLVVCAVIAFGFIILADSTRDDGFRW